MPRRVGIVGYGHLGQYLTKAVLEDPSLELAFVWNRTKETLDNSDVPKSLILDDLTRCGDFNADLIVEVAHPKITNEFGTLFLECCDFMIGSPTALANAEVESKLRSTALTSGHGLYVPSGAFWGGEDVRKMADRGTLKGLIVTMRKHPSSFKLDGDLRAKNAEVKDVAVTLYDGPVRALCPLAPNNVNTMAAAAVAAHNLGFDGTIGRLVSDPNLRDWHYVEVEAIGPRKNGRDFRVETIRKNPADPGAVTGSATYASFLSSILLAKGKGPGVHLC